MESSSPEPQPLWRQIFGSGCIWMLGTMFISGVLLVLNAIFCISLYFGFVTQFAASNRRLGSWLESSVVSQLFMFITPVLMLAIQWLLIDALRDHFANRNSAERR
jgi:hypothetical protein